MTLTEKEKIILKAGCDSEYNSICSGGDWVFATIDNSKLGSKVARGVISSLVKKGLIEIEDQEGNGKPNDMAIFCTKKGKEVCINEGFEDKDVLTNGW